ncbi:RNA-binding protein [Varunaivibrio sulfuroxidans]|uniref:YlxR domain-containing protein n=1 Tax=Varunaivibrio sulfuroxidans TaxID=1773489 RepID=A0A4R3JFZ0_9PROT|nr:RNA-binding protein [Varunaivibrio sulfuroxidans]TCS65058.1 hypothetical protein EDD55_101392 [Varunaivibrio sulfuroxidans]WES29655.1 RNA-binding protein [Varunaivibrio sulfuroxidans]
MADGGGNAHPTAVDGATRRCIVSGAHHPRATMLRFVVGPDDRIVPDVAGKLPGRGLWLCASRDMVHTAIGRKLFAKAARRRVVVDADLADRIEALLERRCLEIIALARRAGQVVAGFGKVRESLRAKGPAGVVLAARDGAPDGRAKVRALAGDTPVLDLFDAADLGHTLGRERTVHAAVAPGRLAEVLLIEAERLKGMRRTEHASR